MSNSTMQLTVAKTGTWKTGEKDYHNVLHNIFITIRKKEKIQTVFNLNKGFI